MLNITTRLDLEKIIHDKLPESLTLDYKASPALNKSSDGRSELVKDITAFANSAGGQIIYGVAEKDGVPMSLDAGVSRTDISPEWIAQVIDTNSSPRVQDIEVKPILTDSSTSSKVYYIVSVSAATIFAPHQNSIDNKYYKRFERRSVPMHDYEIRDLLRRGNSPELRVRFKFKNNQAMMPMPKPDEPFEINVELENISSEPALYSCFDFYFDKQLEIVNDAGLKGWRNFDIPNTANSNSATKDFQSTRRFPAFEKHECEFWTANDYVMYQKRKFW
jgi:Putative DNA-binding domain